MPNPSDHLPLPPRDYVVLFALAEGARHGYGIVKDVETQSGGAVRMDPSNLYRSLKRLMRLRWVTEAAGPEREDRRKLYTITSFGRRVLKAEAMRLHTLSKAALDRQLIVDTSKR